MDHLSTRLSLAICDDEQSDCAQIEQMTNDILREEGVEADVACYDSASALHQAMQAGRVFHMLILDVMMGEGMSGMELAAELRARNNKAAIIFISSNHEMALRGYEVSAARFLAKPVDREKLREALVHCCAFCQQHHSIVLPTASGQCKFAPSAIAYVETWERGVRLHLGAENVEIRLPISQIAEMLPEKQFAYCHRTLLVNLDHVHRVRYCELELKNGEHLPISKYRFADFKNAVLQHLKD